MEKSLQWKPQVWVAVVLAIVAQPLAMLYVRRPNYALAFLLASFLLGILMLVSSINDKILDASGVALMICCVIISYRAAKHASTDAQPIYSRWYVLLGIALGFAVSAVLFRTFVFEPFRIPSTAMMPTLELNSRIVVQKYGFGHFSTYGLNFGRRPHSLALHRGDIIAFDYPRDPRQTYLKRLAGLPGDRIQYLDKDLIVNGQATRAQKLDDYLNVNNFKYLKRYLNKLDNSSFETIENLDSPPFFEDAWKFPMNENCARVPKGVECTVPSGHYFVMGDNRDNSLDSRYWGFVRTDQIIGPVVAQFK